MRHTVLRGPAFLCICRRYATGASPTKKRAASKSTQGASATKNDKENPKPKRRKKATEDNGNLSGKKKQTTLEIGTAFEMRSLELLRNNFSMSLERVAGPGDGGVDLVGWWWLPRIAGLPSTSGDAILDGPKSEDLSPGRSRIRVLAQCKAEKGKIGPNYVRELEGVLHRLLYSQSNGAHDIAASNVHEVIGDPVDTSTLSPRLVPTLAMLISQSSFTNGAVLRAMSSPIPFILLHLPLEPDSGESAQSKGKDQSSPSLQWNPVLGSEKGLLGGNLEVRWERREEGGYPTLWWKGHPMPSCIPIV